MTRGKQVHVIKVSTRGMSWNQARGHVAIRGHREAESDRPYRLVIDDVDDMQRLVTHLQNAIAGIEGWRHSQESETRQDFRCGDVVRIKGVRGIEYEVAQVEPGTRKGQGLARLKMLTEPREINITWRAFRMLELVRRPTSEG